MRLCLSPLRRRETWDKRKKHDKRTETLDIVLSPQPNARTSNEFSRESVVESTIVTAFVSDGRVVRIETVIVVARSQDLVFVAW